MRRKITCEKFFEAYKINSFISNLVFFRHRSSALEALLYVEESLERFLVSYSIFAFLPAGSTIRQGVRDTSRRRDARTEPDDDEEVRKAGRHLDSDFAFCVLVFRKCRVSSRVRQERLRKIGSRSSRGRRQRVTNY